MNQYHAPEDDMQQFRLRVLAASVFVLVGCVLLVVRLYALQVERHEHYHTLAEENRISLLPVVPYRGNIVDRNGVTLARNFVAYTLEIAPSRTAEGLEKTIDDLARIIAIEPKDRRRFYKLLSDNRRLESVPIRTRLSEEEVARFLGQRYRFSGVDVQARLFRDYPFGALASHLIGYIGRINDKDVENFEISGDTANYRGSEYMGKWGVEATYETDLHGTTGVEQIEVNAGGRAVRRLSHEPAVAGNDIELSVDIELQKIAETAFGQRRGALVAIDPTTGEVLAMVSTPTFDPNLFVDGIANADWRMLNESIDKPLLNRATNSAYPPGSTFKPFMALAGLTAGKRTLTQAISDPGFFWYGGHTFMDDKKGGHGSVNLHKSIVVSCNTYYYMLANDLGIDGISGFMGQLGLGSRTGVDLPGEAEGVLPSQAWKKKRFRRPEMQKWYGGETISVGIGQGYNAYTPIQMATALATVANDGKRMRPHVVRAITDSQGQRHEPPAELVKEIDVKPEHITAVRQAMEDVTRYGTGARAFAGAPYRSGGKTGTAQVYSLKGEKFSCKNDPRRCDHSWYIAYAPAEAPKIALAVLVENGGFGAASAAPIARQVIDYFLLNKSVNEPAPEDSEAEDSADHDEHEHGGAE